MLHNILSRYDWTIQTGEKLSFWLLQFTPMIFCEILSIIIINSEITKYWTELQNNEWDIIPCDYTYILLRNNGTEQETIK